MAISNYWLLPLFNKFNVCACACAVFFIHISRACVRKRKEFFIMASELQMIQSISNANNAWSAQQAQKQMDFQREMSNSAHQREVLDLQKAGLNPVLSAFNDITPFSISPEIFKSLSAADS